MVLSTGDPGQLGPFAEKSSSEIKTQTRLSTASDEVNFCANNQLNTTILKQSCAFRVDVRFF